jgi:hypothetical protein
MQRAQVVLTKEVLHVSSPQGISSIVALPYCSTPIFSISFRIAKWLARDPLKESEKRQGMNIYKYVQNNPIYWIDLLGLQPLFGSLGSMGLSNDEKRVLCGYSQIQYQDEQNSDAAMLAGLQNTMLNMIQTTTGFFNGVSNAEDVFDNVLKALWQMMKDQAKQNIKDKMDGSCSKKDCSQ